MRGSTVGLRPAKHPCLSRPGIESPFGGLNPGNNRRAGCMATLRRQNGPPAWGALHRAPPTSHPSIMSHAKPTAQAPEPLGMWLVGARGAIATTLAVGLAALRQGLAEPTGVTTASGPLAVIGWPAWQDWHLGGHDVCAREIGQAALELARAGVVPERLLEPVTESLQAFEAAIRPGLLDPGSAPADALEISLALGQASPREQIEALRKDWDAFEADRGLRRSVIVYVASTEALPEPQDAWHSLAALEAALDRGERQPASVLYAYAALASGRAFVNFTPNLGANCPALRELAEKHGVPHCGNDGKTGETLLKTALAPMFHARALKVLSWQGYNMLGNRDGDVLRQEGHREAKLANKDEALRSILQPGSVQPDSVHSESAHPDPLHSHVAIDYVPSLGDWKTAWDFVHFEGFLGTKMSLQFTWAGCDSALAAPLILDLARLADLAQRRGESGVLAHTACFFKAPLSGGTHDFHQQYQRLLEYLGECLQA